MHEYRVVMYWSEADESFVAEAPELPGCMAHGETREAALRNVQNAIELWIETSRELGEPVPRPGTGRLAIA